MREVSGVRGVGGVRGVSGGVDIDMILNRFEENAVLHASPCSPSSMRGLKLTTSLSTSPT